MAEERGVWAVWVGLFGIRFTRPLSTLLLSPFVLKSFLDLIPLAEPQKDRRQTIVLCHLSLGSIFGRVSEKSNFPSRNRCQSERQKNTKHQTSLNSISSAAVW